MVINMNKTDSVSERVGFKDPINTSSVPL